MFRITDLHANHQSALLLSKRCAQVSYPQVRAQNSPEGPQNDCKVMIGRKIVDTKYGHHLLAYPESLQPID